MIRFLGATAVALVAGTSVQAATTITLTTEFNTDDGFVTGSTEDITLSGGGLSVTFSGGQQQQMFNPAAYNQGPAGFLFLNGTLPDIAGDPNVPGPATGGNIPTDPFAGDTGLIDFSVGATEVSFFAANLGNGTPVLTAFGEDDTTILGTFNIFAISNQDSAGAALTVISAGSFAGNLIGSIGIDLPGPAQNAPYALAIDSFSVVAEVPLPMPALLLLGGLAGLGLARRDA